MSSLSLRESRALRPGEGPIRFAIHERSSRKKKPSPAATASDSPRGRVKPFAVTQRINKPHDLCGWEKTVEYAAGRLSIQANRVDFTDDGDRVLFIAARSANHVNFICVRDLRKTNRS